MLVIESPIQPIGPRAASLAELIYRVEPGEDPREPIILGTAGERSLDVSLGGLRAVLPAVAKTLAASGLRPGDTACLMRLPRTSEAVLAVAYAGLTAAGVRVLLPMFPEAEALGDWLRTTDARAILWSAGDVRDGGHDADREQYERYRAVAVAAGVPALCLQADLGIESLVRACGRTPRDPDPDDVHRLLAAGAHDRDCLILTTAGSSGRSKLVRYHQRALLRSCASWEAAGLYGPDRQGGRALNLLFSHSMGVRAFWNAMWTRRAICLIPPEWFLEHPERVRALLGHMRPTHVTGGPGVYRALLELARVYPDLKDDVIAGLKTAVSSGAPFDPDLTHALRTTLGLMPANAFGMTELMQVLSTMAPGPRRAGLGNPLPGVRIGLTPCEEAGPDVHRLSVQTPFGFSGYLANGSRDGARPDEWFATGDLVRLAPDGLHYVGREAGEFLKDAFGVKIPARLIADRYAGLGPPVTHIEWYPLRHEPGLAALVFVDPAWLAPYNGTGDRAAQTRVRALIEARHDRLAREIDDFEYRHLTVRRFACVRQPPPLTAKGTVARGELARHHAAVIADLTDRYRRHRGIVQLDPGGRPSDAGRFVHPRTAELLRLLRLDKAFVAAAGDRLRYRDGTGEHTVVDFVGGFGTSLLGHRHPDVVRAARDYLDGGAAPIADQASTRRPETDLARQLALLIGRSTGADYVVRFGSTGAEAVEMALAHAFLEREQQFRRFVRDQQRRFGASHPDEVARIVRQARTALRRHRPMVLAIEGSFHGHSLGARAVTAQRRSRRRYRALFGLSCRFLRPDGSDDLDRIVADAALDVPALALEDGHVVERRHCFSRIIAAIAEPVRGEGGVKVVSPGLLQRLAGYEFPLVLDEIQCGLGRVGRIPAAGPVRGHYYLLGKALGGGVAKVSAVLIERSRYRPEFDEDYLGTFAGDGLSCRIASEVIDVIERDDVPARAASRGAALRRRLESVRDDFPDVIRGVEGLGLMLGLELAPAAAQDRLLLRWALERGHLGVLAASYLLNRWDVRVLPTLSAPNTLRLEPSAYVDDDALERLEQALRAFCAAVRDGRTDELVGALVAEDCALEGTAPPPEFARPFTGPVEPPAPGAVRVGFLSHFIHPERELAFVDPSLGALPPAGRRALFQRLVGLLDFKPNVAFARNLFGGRLWFCSIVLPVDAAALEEMRRSGEVDEIVDRVQEGVDLARRMGCVAVGLGAYTSIVTDAGRSLYPTGGVRLATGNALTAAVGVRRVRRCCARRGLDPERPDTRLGIVGATGNIGAVLAKRLLLTPPGFRRILLLGRNEQGLAALRAALERAAQETGLPWTPDLEVSTDLHDLRHCNVVIAATGTNGHLIDTHHLPAAGPVVLADLSAPSIVAPDVRRLAHVQQLEFAGTVRVPGTADFSMASHIPAGTAFSCAGETMLLGLEPEATRDLTLVGPIQEESVATLEQLAVRWGLIDPRPMAPKPEV